MKSFIGFSIIATSLLISCTPQEYFREGFLSNDELNDFLISDLPSCEDSSTPFVHKYKSLLNFYCTVDDVSDFDAYGEQLFNFLINSEVLTFVGYYYDEIDLSNAFVAAQSFSLLDFRSDFPTYSFYYTDRPDEGKIIRGLNLTLSYSETPLSVDVGEENLKTANIRMVLSTRSFKPVYEND